MKQELGTLSLLIMLATGTTVFGQVSGDVTGLGQRMTFPPETLPVNQSSLYQNGFNDDCVDSACNSTPSIWKPLCINSLFCEGWFQPWIAPPSTGSSGAPRQGWLNTADGFFTKEYHLFYGFTNNVRLAGNQSQDVHTGLFQLQLPLSRRVWFGFDAPFNSVTDRSSGQPNETAFDDLRVITKFMLQETRNHSLSSELGVRIPSGDADVGGSIGSLTPKINSWRDIGNAWSLRWALGIEVFTEGIPASASDTDLLYNLALGRTTTPHEVTPFGDFTYHLSLNGRTNLNGAQNRTFMSLTPGVRTHLMDNIFFLAAYEVPVTGPNPFDNRFLFQIVRGL